MTVATDVLKERIATLEKQVAELNVELAEAMSERDKARRAHEETLVLLDEARRDAKLREDERDTLRAALETERAERRAAIQGWVADVAALKVAERERDEAFRVRDGALDAEGDRAAERDAEHARAEALAAQVAQLREALKRADGWIPLSAPCRELVDAALRDTEGAAKWLDEKLSEAREAAGKHLVSVCATYGIVVEIQSGLVVVRSADPLREKMAGVAAEARAAALRPLADAMEAVKAHGWSWVDDRKKDLGDRLWEMAETEWRALAEKGGATR